MTHGHGVGTEPGPTHGTAGGRLRRACSALTWAGTVASGLAVLGLALPTRVHAWFHDTPRTEDITLESWAHPATIDLGNVLTLLPMLAFLAALATLLLAVLALRRPLLALAGTGAALIAQLMMLLAWATQASYSPMGLPPLLLLGVSGTLLLAAGVLHLVAWRLASRRGAVPHQSWTVPSRRRFTGR